MSTLSRSRTKIARHTAKNKLKLDNTWRFPNGSFYYRHGIPIHPTSDVGRVIAKILTRQYDEEK